MTHHTAPRGPKMARVGEVEEQVTHDGLRAQKTPPPGERPGILPEPLPQRSDRSRRHFSGDGLPQLAMTFLAGAAGLAMDAAVLAFLLSQSLAGKEHEDQKKREEEAKEALKAWKVRRKRVRDEFMALIDTPTLTPPRGEEAAGARDDRGGHGRLEAWLLLGFFFHPEEEKKEEEYRVRGLASPHPILGATLVLSVARGVLWISWEMTFNVDIISTAPVSDSHLFGVRPWSTRLWTFLGDDFWKEFVFSFWFNTGYMFTSVFRGFLGYFTQVVREGGLGPCGPFCPFTPAFSDEEVTALVVDNSGCGAPRAVFPLIVGVLVVDCGGILKAGFAGDDAFHATFPLVAFFLAIFRAPSIRTLSAR